MRGIGLLKSHHCQRGKKSFIQKHHRLIHTGKVSRTYYSNNLLSLSYTHRVNTTLYYHIDRKDTNPLALLKIPLCIYATVYNF